jgi:integrase
MRLTASAQQAPEHDEERGLHECADSTGRLREEYLSVFANDATRKHVTFHDLKATGGTWAALRGDNPLAIMERLAHRDLKTH